MTSHLRRIRRPVACANLRPALCLLAALLAGATLAHAQPAKKPLDHDVYDAWQQIREKALSDDGQWLSYVLAPEDGDPELFVRHLQSERLHRVPQGLGAAFEDNAAHLVFLLKPTKESLRQAKREEKKKEDHPKDALGILDLASGGLTRIEQVKSFKLPKKASGYVAYLLEKPPAEKKDAKAEEGSKEKNEEPPGETGAEKTAETPAGRKKNEKKAEGTPLVLRNLATGAEQRFEDALEYVFTEDGRWLAYTASNKDGKADGIFAVDTATGQSTALLTGKGVYKQPVFDEAGRQLAFLGNRDDVEADQPRFTLYHWRVGTAAPTALATEGAGGIAAGWWVSEHGALAFSKQGRRLYFGTAPRPAPENKDDTVLDEEKPVLDVWNWQDPLLQPMQLKQLEAEKKRSYRAVAHLSARSRPRIVQLATESMPDVVVGADGDADVAVANTGMPYRRQLSWDSKYSDVYLIDVDTGQARGVLEALHGEATLSPQGRYLTWWNDEELAWYALAVNGGRPVNLTAAIGHPLHNELHDRPEPPDAYGSAGWTKNDAQFLVYDRHDIWALDPKGQQPPRCVTEGAAREADLRLRYIRLDPEERFIDPAAPMLLSAFDLSTRDSGYYRDTVNGNGRPRRLIMMDRLFSNVAKAEDSERLLFTRESFQEFPDLWVSGADFADARKVTDANPQQKEYSWGTAELVNWDSLDGQPLQGILYKPDDFDPSRQYPMMVYFYERFTDRLHSHHAPAPGRSGINFSFYVSRGYLLLVPDIPYRIGYPGPSAMSAVLPGVNSLTARGFVDKARIGVQGHSWGGYQIAYMVTQTDLFAAAEAGAPVANMISAYGGIRWSTGMSRQFQYEKTQSRIGGTLWEYPLRFIDNSPVFHVDRIHTPLLMMHNDQDGAVPWYQGIELFTAGRRLGKPMWLLNYGGEDHWVMKYPNKKDFAVRLQQFFDHYLKDAPMPVWMKEGVPAIRKGRTLGLEY